MSYYDSQGRQRRHWPIWADDRKSEPGRDETLNPDLDTPPSDAARKDDEREQQGR
jgi:hypothetical protein